MWIGFGSTVAKNFGCPTASAEKKYTTIEGCPQEWIDAIQTPNSTANCDDFNHLPIYEVSYMWYSAIACMICIVVGIIVRFVTIAKEANFQYLVKFMKKSTHKLHISFLSSFLTGPQDPKKLNPDLVSPAFKKLFAWWPKFIRDRIDAIDIGSEFVSTDMILGSMFRRYPN